MRKRRNTDLNFFNDNENILKRYQKQFKNKSWLFNFLVATINIFGGYFSGNMPLYTKRDIITKITFLLKKKVFDP